MSFSNHHKHQNHVRFFDDIQAAEAGHRAQRAPKIEPAATSNQEEGPHFPNLYKMFKHKPGATQSTTDKGVIEKVENRRRRKGRAQDRVQRRKRSERDTAAAEYIKRKHPT
ncbi:hypothetical protein M6B38_140570 [Iris pallida]|uniref:Uncharacterized protein n=1 Tax=Iris pallida TaxID=29817 RepID=A0AAX6FCP7_IRIPA|nr:hypothetical protein M6B38_140570 [Iris pallida]